MFCGFNIFMVEMKILCHDWMPMFIMTQVISLAFHFQTMQQEAQSNASRWLPSDSVEEGSVNSLTLQKLMFTLIVKFSCLMKKAGYLYYIIKFTSWNINIFFCQYY